MHLCTDYNCTSRAGLCLQPFNLQPRMETSLRLNHLSLYAEGQHQATAELPEKTHSIVEPGWFSTGPETPSSACPADRQLFSFIAMFDLTGLQPPHLHSNDAKHHVGPSPDAISSSRKGHELCPIHLALLTPNIVPRPKLSVNTCLFYDQMNKWMFNVKRRQFSR